MDDFISRQAAIEALDQIFDRCEEIEAHLPEGDPDRTGYKMYPDYMTVWKYLHQLPFAQPLNPCETCLHKGKGWDEDPCDGCTGTESKYEPERKKGEWLDGSDERFVKCSKCGMETTRNELQGIALFGKEEPNFCPNCGADMRGET